MKSLANCISFSRILLAFALLLVPPLGLSYISIYLVCGITDILDGYAARKTNTVSKLGAKIDSIADLVMAAAILISLYPIIKTIISAEIILWIVIIAVIRFLSIIVVLIKYKTFEILHTYGNKLTGLLLLIFPLSLTLGQSNAFVYIICVTATLSALEELFIHLASNELQTNRKSIFKK